MSNIDMEFDEKTMIREQERLEREKKRAQRRKTTKVVLLIVCAIIVAGAAYLVWLLKLKPQMQATGVEVVKQVGQEVVIAKITQIHGNEITYTVCEEVEQKQQEEKPSDEKQSPFTDGDKPSGREERPEGMPDMGEMPEGMPQMPEGMEFPGRGEGISEESGVGRGQQMTAASEDTFVYDNKTYTLTEEAVTTYIPVGTVVTTKLGTQTTFSRLAADDYVALVVEGKGDEQMIMSVYIIG